MPNTNLDYSDWTTNAPLFGHEIFTDGGSPLMATNAPKLKIYQPNDVVPNPFDIIYAGTMGPAMNATYQAIGMGPDDYPKHTMLTPGTPEAQRVDMRTGAPIQPTAIAPWESLGRFVNPLTGDRWEQAASGQWDLLGNAKQDFKLTEEELRQHLLQQARPQLPANPELDAIMSNIDRSLGITNEESRNAVFEQTLRNLGITNSPATNR